MEVVVGLDGLAAVFASQVEGTSAVEVVGQINASAGRWADPGQAVVLVHLAVLPGVARGADAHVVGSVIHAGGAVLAHIVGTSIILILATHAGVGSGTRTVQPGAKVSAEASVQARRSDAALGGGLATLSVSSGRTSSGRK